MTTTATASAGAPSRAGPTPSQTIGPFFHVALASPAPGRFGDRAGTRLVGRVLAGDAAPVDDALVEMWDGVDLARCSTSADGSFEFVVPVDDVSAATPADESPYVAVSVFARGLLNRLVTRCYLPAPQERLDRDAVYTAAPPLRRRSLLAVPAASDADDTSALRFDIRLQGEGETVFHAW